MTASGTSSPSIDLLVLGGTKFLGRAIVDEALAKGHSVTLFNRGQTNPELYAGRAEQLVGDRTSDLGALSGRSFDAVVDVAAYFPHVVERSARALSGSVGRYMFVSTVSVYDDWTTPSDETAPLAELDDPFDESVETYGARKAASEEVARSFFGEKATVVRPGLIVGPLDPTDRFAYWPRRIAEGGTVLAPGNPTDPVQFIDVRDLASFILRLIEDDVAGTFNATGVPLGFGELLECCKKVRNEDAELVWVPSERLLAAGLDPWMGVALWIAAAPDAEAANLVVVDKALSAGLTFRPLEETVRGAGDGPPTGRSELSRELEAELVAEMSRKAEA